NLRSRVGPRGERPGPAVASLSRGPEGARGRSACRERLARHDRAGLPPRPVRAPTAGPVVCKRSPTVDAGICPESARPAGFYGGASGPWFYHQSLRPLLEVTVPPRPTPRRLLAPPGPALFRGTATDAGEWPNRALLARCEVSDSLGLLSR